MPVSQLPNTRICINRIPQNRMAQMRQGRANLMQKPGTRTHFDETGVGELFERANLLHRDANAARVLAGWRLGHANFRRTMLGDKQANLLLDRFTQIAGHQSSVCFFNAMLTKRPTQSLPRALFRRNQQHARRFDVESVHHAAAKSPFANTLHFGLHRHDDV